MSGSRSLCTMGDILKSLTKREHGTAAPADELFSVKLLKPRRFRYLPVLQ